MRITVVSYGTRGDIQPMVAIAHALRARGHDVLLGTPENHVAFARATGLEVLPIAGSSEEILESPEGRAWVERGDLLRLVRAMITTHERLADDVERDISTLTEDCDGVITGLLPATMVRVFSELRSFPMWVAHTFPSLPSREVVHGALHFPDWVPGAARYATTKALAWSIWRAMGRTDKRIRHRHGLPQAREDAPMALWRAGHPSLHLWSPLLQPRPQDWPHDIVTGFCALPPELRAGLGESESFETLLPFLDEGPPPVYIGLGSMPIFDTEAAMDVVLRALQRTGLRAIVSGALKEGARLRGSLPEHVRWIGPVDHDRLFPRCAAIVHHGGAGSTATSARAGRPTLVAPVFGDQRYWGHRLETLGVGLVLPFRRWTPERLGDALQGLLQPSRVQAAAALGRAMQAERPGGEVVAETVEALLAR